MAEMSSRSQFVFSVNIANMIPKSPLNNMVNSWRIKQAE